MTGKLCSSQNNTRILNWRAYGEGCAAANNGQPIGDNPHDPVGNPIAYNDWNDGYNGVNQECCPVGGDGNLWTDPPDFVGPGWTDNGNGTYTCDGSDGTSLEKAASIVDDATYDVEIEIIANASGSIEVYIAGATKFKEVTALSGVGVNAFPMTIDTNFPGATNIIIINSSSFVGTIGNIYVVQQ